MPGFFYLKPGGCLRDLAGKSAAGSREQKQEFRQKLGHSINIQTYTVSLLVGDASLCINKTQLLQTLLEPQRPQPALVALSVALHPVSWGAHSWTSTQGRSVAFSFKNI